MAVNKLILGSKACLGRRVGGGGEQTPPMPPLPGLSQWQLEGTPVFQAWPMPFFSRKTSFPLSFTPESGAGQVQLYTSGLDLAATSNS